MSAPIAALAWELPAAALARAQQANLAAQVVVETMSEGTRQNLLITAAVLSTILLIQRMMVGWIHSHVESQAIRYRWTKAIAYAGSLVGILILIQVWFSAIRSLGTFLGLLTAGLAIALKDLIADLAGWFFILWRRPFELGDRIEVAGLKGDVVDRTLFQITLMEVGNWIDADQSTGRLIHIPNSHVFMQPLANYVAGFPYLWNEVKVLVTMESDWRRAKKILEELAEYLTVEVKKEVGAIRRKDEDRFLIRYRTLTPIVYTTVEGSGIQLTLRYICGPRERRATAAQLWERILTAFESEPDIDFAYPTQRTVGEWRRVSAEAPMDPGGDGPAG